MSAEQRLKTMGIELPGRPAALANYIGAVRDGPLLFVSGHIPVDSSGKLAVTGKLGRDLTVEQGYAQARIAGLNILATMRDAIGSLDKVRKIVRVLGLVSSAEGFSEQPKVLNGFSDLFVDVFGEEIGRHARSAVGVAELPKGAPVEVELIASISA
jgi:enamine deaminase RidA (YjgF/YER057c/UK114 family)